MSQNTYELIALAMRYFFAGMMLLIVLRAGRGALIDSRRAAIAFGKDFGNIRRARYSSS